MVTSAHGFVCRTGRPFVFLYHALNSETFFSRKEFVISFAMGGSALKAVVLFSLSTAASDIGRLGRKPFPQNTSIEIIIKINDAKVESIFYTRKRFFTKKMPDLQFFFAQEKITHNYTQLPSNYPDFVTQTKKPLSFDFSIPNLELDYTLTNESSMH